MTKNPIRVLILPFAALLSISLSSYADTGIVLTEENKSSIIQSSDNLSLGIPSEADTVINRTGYALGYNEKHEQAEWVSYKLTKKEVLTKATSRTDDFREDPLIRTGSAALNDYRRSGYDRGHLAPAADMHWSKTTMSESFFLSNMSPQKPYFNRAIWRKLEAQVREWAIDNDEIFVVTGGVLNNGLTNTIGSNAVTIPDYYYKVVLDYKEPEIKAIGLLLKNEKSSSSLSSFVVSVDKIEDITGMDFFSRLPDSVEERLEATTDISKWSWTTKTHSYSRKSSKSSSQKAAVKDTEKGFWLNTSSNSRHNPSCKYFKNTKRGRPCGKDEGKPCGICGG